MELFRQLMRTAFGSSIDAGKAISAMLPSGDSVVEYLECKDTRKHDGRKTPFIAIPTSSGCKGEWGTSKGSER